ncbi:hypothetical protein PUW24_00055 (plasmid) [Paenibacillus urinalis]|uniref:DUF3993 domain-containing protein n=1 Tax=Paenibacillus urinalis TaxID=521520 RepID=A0AAX3N6E6_9BACL|nr:MULTISPECIES: hypothetical protein [Paenibacillus]MCM3130500.1 hypothetical protein [Paenibacillus sp. MER 78]WDH85386.1 hypothetical protein PUW23_25455 [Paenibacillus urinalis]WDH95175.1 hypothetical protein PUW24_00055 [Paenibacillus urinalis]WDI05352.1 hypothetical protein PUW25_26535 [Paenibacillus urinalis]
MDIFSKLVAGFIALILMMLYPLYQSTVRHDNQIQTVVHQTVTEFVDAVRTKGYISPEMYLQFNKKLGETGNVYDVTLEHMHKKYNPVYSDPANPATFQNSFDTYYEGHYTEEIMKVLFPETNIPADNDSRKYKLALNDFITVSVKNKNRTMSTIMQDFILVGNSGDVPKIYMNYGGMVLNEDY